ncbi:hypothetical protein [Micromonospora sp. NPDC005189]|uniref:hypothetical protein n=1 Tax=unclassified Micromonospora TaxID=2617518 RepID=UPI0033BEC2A7
MRRGIPEAGEDLSLLWHTARQLAGQRWQAVVLAGTAMWVVGQALQQFASVWAVLGGLMAAVGAVGVPLVFWEVHRAEAYLRDHPDPTGR